MKKLNLILLLLTLSTSICEGQATFNTFGHFGREPLSREYFKILDNYNGELLVAEMRSLSGISLGGRVLSIRSIDKKTLKVSKRAVYKNISIAKRKDELSFMSIWQNNEKIQVLVMNNKTHDIALLSIDASTLVLSETGQILFSISEYYKKASFDVVNSKNGKYTYVLVYLNEGSTPTTMLGYLIGESGNVIGKSRINPQTDFQLNKENTALKVLDDGRAVIVMNIRDDKVSEGSKSGINVYLVSKNGQLNTQKHIQIPGTLPNGAPIEGVNLQFATKDGNLYIAGYESTGHGTVTGVLDINSHSISYNLTFQPFREQTIAELGSSIDEIIKNTSKVIRSKSLTVTENGDFVLVGSVVPPTVVYKTTTPNSIRTATVYKFGSVLVHRISLTNIMQYTKVISLSQFTTSAYSLPLYQHKAFEVNGEIALFINDSYPKVSGYQMKYIEARNQKGAIVIISKDGSEWRKEPFRLNKNVEVCWVIPIAGVVEEDGAIVMPIKPEDRTNVGYIRFRPNK